MSELPAKRREREREELRRQIITAAQRLFVTEGYESTTIRRIADAVEYTPGAIYSYFKDKDEILYAIHQAGFLELQRSLTAAAITAPNPLEQLLRLGDAYVAFARQNPELYHLMFVAQATSRTLTQAEEWPEGTAAYDALRSVVRAAVTDGWIRPGDPEVIAFTLWSTAHGSVTLEICNRCMVLPEQQRESMIPLTYRYLVEALALRSPSEDAEPANAEPKKRRFLPEQ